MARGHDQGLLAGEFLQVALDEPVLHPVLADLPGFAVGDELVRIQGHVEIEIVVDHDLKRLAFGAAPAVVADGLPAYRSLGPETVAVDTSPGLELFQEFRGQRGVPCRRDIAQRIF